MSHTAAIRDPQPSPLADSISATAHAWKLRERDGLTRSKENFERSIAGLPEPYNIASTHDWVLNRLDDVVAVFEESTIKALCRPHVAPKSDRDLKARLAVGKEMALEATKQLGLGSTAWTEFLDGSYDEFSAQVVTAVRPVLANMQQALGRP